MQFLHFWKPFCLSGTHNHSTTQHNPAGRRFPPRPRLSKAAADMWTNPATGPTSRASPGQKPEAPPPLNLKAGWLVRSQNWRAGAAAPKTNGPTNHRVPDTSGHATPPPFSIAHAWRAWAAMLLGSWSSMRSSAQVTELLL